MDVKINIGGKEYDFKTSNDSESEKISIDFNGLKPHVENYLKSVLEEGTGVFGKIVSLESMTNLDLIAILSEEDLLISNSPEIEAPKSTKDKMF